MTASDLAALCEVDLKTIHNWVDRGRIPHFRTPGRHLRFRAADVAEFLRAWGYSVPRELARASAPTVLVVGTSETRALVHRALSEGAQPPGAPPASSGQPVRLVSHPYDALLLAGADPGDVYVVDLESVAAEIEPSAMFEALRRASPQGSLVALSDEPATLPAFVTRLARGDTAGLKKMIAPTAPVAIAATPNNGAASAATVSRLPESPPEEQPPRAVSSGGR
ncbi:MAG: helix-turn-helix domain-containing protein [Byssovorax sp.]